MNYGYVKQAVGDRGRRGYVGIIAILRSAATGYQERLLGKHLPVCAHSVDLRMEFDIFRYCAFQVHQLAAPVLTGKVAAYGGIESDAECTEKRMPVDRTVVAVHYVVFGDNLNRGLRFYRNAEMARQSVARTAASRG